MPRITWSLVCVASLVLSCGGGETSVDGQRPYTLDMLDQQVVINGVKLDQRQLAEFQQRYGQGPRPGRYWYDTKSGLFGSEGGPALGWIHPGHSFGTLSPDASRGSSGVFVNDRQLDASDCAALATIFGGVVVPGRYWLDGMGNYGYEGYQIPAGQPLPVDAGAGRSNGAAAAATTPGARASRPATTPTTQRRVRAVPGRHVRHVRDVATTRSLRA
jgi:hypothetical protein